MDQKIISMSQQLHIGESLKYAAHNVPNRDIFVYGDERITYQEFLKKATHLAGWLQSKGIEKNEKVGCLFKNGMPFVDLYFGTSISGAVFVPINFRLVAKEIEYIINQSDIKILFVEEEFIEKILPIVDSLHKVQLIVTVGSRSVNTSIESTSYESIYLTSTSFHQIVISFFL